MSPSAAEKASYREMIRGIAESCPEGIASVLDLPDLTLDQLAITLRHYPTACIEALSESDPEIGELCADRLADEGKREGQRYSHLGLCIAGVIRSYVKGLILRDAMLEIERQLALDSLEEPAEAFS